MSEEKTYPHTASHRESGLQAVYDYTRPKTVWMNTSSEPLGVDDFIYYASMGLGQKEQKRSLELFCKEVLPAFT